MKFGMTALAGVLFLVALGTPSNAGFDLSIGNISVNGTGGAFSVYATATDQTQVITGYSLKLNLTAASAGDLPVTFVDGAVADSFTLFDLNGNNVIAAVNGVGAGAGGPNTIGYSAFGAGTPFFLDTPTVVGNFTFTTADGFNPGNFIDVGFVLGGIADTEFIGTTGIVGPLVAIGGTNQAGNNPTVATSTRIAVPEPSTLGVVGLIGFGLATRRRRKA